MHPSAGARKNLQRIAPIRNLLICHVDYNWGMQYFRNRSQDSKLRWINDIAVERKTFTVHCRGASFDYVYWCRSIRHRLQNDLLYSFSYLLVKYYYRVRISPMDRQLIFYSVLLYHCYPLVCFMCFWCTISVIKPPSVREAPIQKHTDILLTPTGRNIRISGDKGNI